MGDQRRGSFRLLQERNHEPFDIPVAQATGSVASVIKSESAKSWLRCSPRSAEVYGAVNPRFIDAPFLSNHDTSLSARSMSTIPLK